MHRRVDATLAAPRYWWPIPGKSHSFGRWLLGKAAFCAICLDVTTEVAVRLTPKAVLLAVCLAVCLAAWMPAAAGPFEETLRGAMERGDYASAMKLWRPLADEGNARAQTALGNLYSLGKGGVVEDRVEALRWYRLAAAQGHANAQASLADFFIMGDGGVARDFVVALMWLELAGNRGSFPLVDAQTRSQLKQRMTPAQIAEAQRLAREWKPSR